MWLKTLLLRINAEMGEGVRCYIATLLNHINNLFIINKTLSWPNLGSWKIDLYTCIYLQLTECDALLYHENHHPLEQVVQALLVVWGPSSSASLNSEKKQKSVYCKWFYLKLWIHEHCNSELQKNIIPCPTLYMYKLVYLSMSLLLNIF